MFIDNLRTLFVFISLFFIVLLPRIHQIPIDMYFLLPSTIYLLVFENVFAVAGSTTMRTLEKAWIWFLPFFFFVFTQSFFLQIFYWPQWALHTILVTFVVPRLAGLLKKKRLNSVFLFIVGIEAVTILLEVFGPPWFKAFLFSFNKTISSGSSEGDLLAYYKFRGSGIVSNIPSAGEVLCLGILVLVNLYTKKSFQFDSSRTRLFFLTIMSIAGCAIWFTARTWVFLTILCLLGAACIKRSGSRILLIVLVTVSVFVYLPKAEHEQARYVGNILRSTVDPIMESGIYNADGLAQLSGEYVKGGDYWSFDDTATLFGSGASGSHEEFGTDVGYLRLLIGIGACGTLLLLIGHLGFATKMFLVTGDWQFRWTIVCLIGVEMVYAFKGFSLFGLFGLPMYFLSYTVLAKNNQEEQAS